MVGEVGRRLPIQLLEAFLLTLTLLKLWSASIHFHQRGKILSFSLIYIGVINILTAPFKDSYDGLLFSTALTIIGIFVFYKISKRRLEADIKSSLSKFSKYWYNQKTSFSWTLRNMKKGLKKLNVRFSFKNN